MTVPQQAARNTKSKREISFPLTVRQAQKLSENPSIEIAPLMEAVGLGRGCTNRRNRRKLKRKLAQMYQQVGASALIHSQPDDSIGALDADATQTAQSQAAPTNPNPEYREQTETGETGQTGGNEQQGSEAPLDQWQQNQYATGSGRDADACATHGGDENRSETDKLTSEGNLQVSEKPQNLDRQVAASPSTALDRGKHSGEKNRNNKSVAQPRDAGDQETGDSQTPEVSNAPTETKTDGEGDRADSAKFSARVGTRAIENGIGEDAPQGQEKSSKGKQHGDDCPTHQKKWGKKFNSSRNAARAARASATSATVTAELGKIGVDRNLLNLCRQQLSRLVSDSSDQEYSPRRDYAEFCVRLKTYRNPAPAHKSEQGRPAILVMADVSGSCAGFSQESIAVAKAASKLGVPGADVLVLSHSNGAPHELEHNGKAIPLKPVGRISPGQPGQDQDCSTWYHAMIQKFRIETVVALGDWDAVDIYAHLARHPLIEKIIWLDNAHASKRQTQAVQDRTKWAIARIAEQGYAKSTLLRQKMIYRNGCKKAADFIKNIKKDDDGR